MHKNEHFIIANLKAGGGRAIKQLKPILRLFQENGLIPEILETKYPRHAIELAETLAKNGANRIISAGGDGTAFEVINGVMRSGRQQDIHLGIIPIGTGNSFLRDFEINSGLDAAKRIIENHTSKADIGKIVFKQKGIENVLFFHNMMGLGFLAEACCLRHTTLKFFGKYGYHAAFFYLLPYLKSYSMRLQIDQQPEIQLLTPLLAICNSQFTGRNMRISPNSSVNDGKFEIIFSEKLTRAELVKFFFTLPTARHLEHPKVQILNATKLNIHVDTIQYAMIDGESEGEQPFSIENLHQALKIYV